jgi:hypothetical protein
LPSLEEEKVSDSTNTHLLILPDNIHLLAEPQTLDTCPAKASFLSFITNNGMPLINFLPLITYSIISFEPDIQDVLKYSTMCIIEVKALMM